VDHPPLTRPAPTAAHRLGGIDKEAVMPFARVVAFDGVSAARAEELKGEMQDGEQPEGMPATEVLFLHDPEAERALVVLFFDTEDDYATGDAVLNAMPAGDTPGTRTSVTKYEVVARMTA
jgi:hypothetical protein